MKEEERKKTSKEALRKLDDYASEEGKKACKNPYTEDNYKEAMAKKLAAVKKFDDSFKPIFPKAFKSYNFLGNTGRAADAINGYITTYFAKCFFKKGFCIDWKARYKEFILLFNHFHIEVSYKYKSGETTWGVTDYGHRIDLKLKLFLGEPIFYIKDAAISGMVLKKHATSLDELIKLTDIAVGGMISITEHYIRVHYLDTWKKDAQENFEWFTDNYSNDKECKNCYVLIRDKRIRAWKDSIEGCIKAAKSENYIRLYSIQKIGDKNPTCFDPTEVFNECFADILNK